METVEIVEVKELTLRQMRALSCLHILQQLAVQKRTVPYEAMAVILGLPHKGQAMVGAISQVLYDVFDHCRMTGHPHLTVLVVRKSGKDVGLPGPGFWKVWAKDGAIPDFHTRVEQTELMTGMCYRLYDHLGK